MRTKFFRFLISRIIFHSLAIFATVLVVIATYFYHSVEKWSLIDSLYFSIITLSTVGYGDFSPHTVEGKLFTIFYILIGLGLFATLTASLAANLLHSLKHEFLKKAND